MNNELNIESTPKQEMRKCARCGRILPLDRFRIVQIKGKKPYSRMNAAIVKLNMTKNIKRVKKNRRTYLARI